MNLIINARTYFTIRNAAFATSSHLGGITREKFASLVEEMSPFTKEFLKPKLLSISKGEISVLLPYRKEFIGNVIIPCQHGGITAAMMDHVGGFCAWSLLEDPHKLVNTVDLRVDYLNPAPCQDLIYEASVAHKSPSSKLIRADISCWNKDRTVQIAIGRALFNVYNTKADVSGLFEHVDDKKH